MIDYILINEAADKEIMSFWTNENVDISDHVMIGVTRKNSKEGKKREKKEMEILKWNLKKAQWPEYRQDLNAAMKKEEHMKDRTINDWERDIKKRILVKARRHIGKIRVNKSGKKLKGWWDEEVKAAIQRRKKANKEQRKLKRIMEIEGKM